jgi:hypothetical protein
MLKFIPVLELPGYKTLAEINAKYKPMKDGEEDEDDEPPPPHPPPPPPSWDRGRMVSSVTNHFSTVLFLFFFHHLQTLPRCVRLIHFACFISRTMNVRRVAIM